MPYQFKNITVLVVETSESMFSLTRDVLITFGVSQIYSAFNPKDGYKTFCRLNPDLVITDWLEAEAQLSLAKMIRTDPTSPNPFVPIILMTGYSQKKRVMLARDSGITEFLVKPFTAKSLYQRIERLIEKPRMFVKSESYFGPDRRRKGDVDYTGPEKRDERQPQPRAPTAIRTAQAIKDRQTNKEKS